MQNEPLPHPATGLHHVLISSSKRISGKKLSGFCVIARQIAACLGVGFTHRMLCSPVRDPDRGLAPPPAGSPLIYLAYSLKILTILETFPRMDREGGFGYGVGTDTRRVI